MGKYLRKNKIKMNIPIRIAALLLCLTLFSTYLVTGLFARYTTSAQGSDNARVAKFSIEGSGTLLQPIVADLIPGKTQSETLILENKSETAVEYTITVTNVYGNLPLEFTLTGGSANSTVHEKGVSTITDQLLPGNHEDTYTLEINWPASTEDLDLIGMVDYVTVTVTAAQID